MSLVQCPSETPHYEPRYFRQTALVAAYRSNGPGMLDFHNVPKVAVKRAPAVFGLSSPSKPGANAPACRRNDERTPAIVGDSEGKYRGNYSQHRTDRTAFVRDRSDNQKLGFMTAETAKILILIGFAVCVGLQLLLVLFTKGV